MSSETGDVDDERVRAIVQEELQRQRSGGVSRRGLLYGLSGLGALGGGLALGSSDSAPVESAQAQTASGQVGTTDRHVDVYANDIIGANSIDADEILNSIDDSAIQSQWDGLISLVGPNLGMQDAIDPSSSSNPIQDAMDALAAENGGSMLLPPGEVISCSTEVNPRSNVSIFGGTPGWNDGTFIRFAPDVNGFNFDEGVRAATYDGINIQGASDDGTSNSTGYGIRVSSGDSGDIRFGNVMLSNWANYAIRVLSPAFQIGFGNLRMWNIDAGDVVSMIRLDADNPAITFDNLSAYGSDHISGSDSRVLRTDNGSAQVSIDNLNLGGTIGQVASNFGGGRIEIDFANYLPDNQNSAPTALFNLNSQDYCRIGGVRMGRGATDYVYELNNSPDNKILGVVEDWENPTINEGLVTAWESPAGRCFYWGDSGEVVDNTGTADTDNLTCLGDLTTAL